MQPHESKAVPSEARGGEERPDRSIAAAGVAATTTPPTTIPSSVVPVAPLSSDAKAAAFAVPAPDNIADDAASSAADPEWETSDLERLRTARQARCVTTNSKQEGGCNKCETFYLLHDKPCDLTVDAPHKKSQNETCTPREKASPAAMQKWFRCSYMYTPSPEWIGTSSRRLTGVPIGIMIAGSCSIYCATDVMLESILLSDGSVSNGSSSDNKIRNRISIGIIRKIRVVYGRPTIELQLSDGSNDTHILSLQLSSIAMRDALVSNLVRVVAANGGHVCSEPRDKHRREKNATIVNRIAACALLVCMFISIICLPPDHKDRFSDSHALPDCSAFATSSSPLHNRHPFAEWEPLGTAQSGLMRAEANCLAERLASSMGWMVRSAPVADDITSILPVLRASANLHSDGVMQMFNMTRPDGSIGAVLTLDLNAERPTLVCGDSDTPGVCQLVIPSPPTDDVMWSTLLSRRAGDDGGRGMWSMEGLFLALHAELRVAGALYRPVGIAVALLPRLARVATATGARVHLDVDLPLMGRAMQRLESIDHGTIPRGATLCATDRRGSVSDFASRVLGRHTARYKCDVSLFVETERSKTTSQSRIAS